MNFSVLPSGITSVRILGGAGRVGELASAAASFSSVISGPAGASWQGAASQAMIPAAVRPVVITHQKVTCPFAACVEGRL
jgi:PPE-repeat protein